MLLRHLQRCAAGPLAACAAGITTASVALRTASGADAPAHAASAASASGKVVHEVCFEVAESVSGDFTHWLAKYLKDLVEKPGMLGAKVLHPLPAAAKPGVVFVLGGPGAGKGTQCGKIVDAFGWTHLSAGDLLRAERKSGSAQGQMIDEYIKEGKIVPVEVTVKLLIDAIRADGGSRFLVDGFPRNTNNLSGWQQVAGSSLQLGGVLFFDCPEATMEERLLERGKTSGRSDDNIESIRKRFHTYQNETTPILAYYDHQEIVHKIDGTREVDAVWADTKGAIATVEQRLNGGTSQPVCAHVYASTESAVSTADLEKRVAAAATARFGEGAVKVRVASSTVVQSLKAFGIDAAPAFD